MTPEDPKLSLEISRAFAEIGKRHNAAPGDLLIQALFALCPIAERLRYGVLTFGAAAASVLSRYHELAQAAGAAAEEPPAPMSIVGRCTCDVADDPRMRGRHAASCLASASMTARMPWFCTECRALGVVVCSSDAYGVATRIREAHRAAGTCGRDPQVLNLSAIASDTLLLGPHEHL